jgi:signal transduction histidine kinase/CheY-like chemotaxis protein
MSQALKARWLARLYRVYLFHIIISLLLYERLRSWGMKKGLLKRISSVFPLEYLALVIGLLLFLESLYLIKEQNQRIIDVQAESVVLYELILNTDTAFIRSTEAIVAGKRYMGTRDPEDHAYYLQALDSARDLFLDLNTVFPKGQIEGSARTDLELLGDILMETRSRLEYFDGELQRGSDWDAGRESLLAEVFRAHEKLSAHVSRLLRTRSEDMKKMVAVNYRRLLLGALIPLLFFFLSFALLRSKIHTIRRYSAELEQETRRARQAEQVKAEFLANMSHEIRTPMTAILGFSELIKDGVTDPRYRNYLDGIASAGNALLTLINDILDLSKIEAGRMLVRPTPMALPDLMRKLDLMIRPMAERKRLELTVQVEGEEDGEAVLPLLLDEDRIRQILINLMGNAVKFTQEGYVRVKARVDGVPGRRTLTVSAEDSGIGISQEHLEVIFESFLQVEGSRTRNFGGTGLGLSISRKLAHLMDGDITVTSRENIGSIFTLTVPEASTLVQGLTVRNPAVSAPIQEDLPRLNGGTVLLVEDDPDSMAVLRGFLEGHGVRVLSARDGLEALGSLEVEPVDLVVTDIMMPNLSGAELVARIRESARLRSLPVIVASASVHRDDLHPLLETTQGFLKKPFRRSEFLDSLARYLPHEKPVFRTPAEKEEASQGLIPAFQSFNANDTELRALLVDRVRPELRILRVTFSMDGMADMGRELEAEGNRLGFTPLADFAHRLLAATENLDIGELNRLLEELEALTAFVDASRAGA